MRNNYEQFILVVSVVFKFLLLFDNSIKQRLSLWRRGESTSKSRSKFGTESHMVSAKPEPITGTLGSPQRGPGQSPWSGWSGGQGAKPLKLNAFCTCTTWGVGQLVLKSVFLCRTKKLCRTFGAPWIRQWENHIRSITTQRLSEIFDCFAKLGSMMAPKDIAPGEE